MSPSLSQMVACAVVGFKEAQGSPSWGLQSEFGSGLGMSGPGGPEVGVWLPAVEPCGATGLHCWGGPCATSGRSSHLACICVSEIGQACRTGLDVP